MATILTVKQERYILEKLKEYEPWENGSSRLVFMDCEQLLADLGLNVPGGREVVVKLSCGIGGMNQTYKEIQTYLEEPTGPFAPIYFYGRFIEIMERVEPVWFQEWLSDYQGDVEHLLEDESDNIDLQEDADALKTCSDIINYMELRYNCYSSDYCQIGISEGGEFYLFDYGYIPRIGWQQCSFDVVDNIVYSEKGITDYLDDCIDFLDTTVSIYLCQDYHTFTDLEKKYENYRNNEEKDNGSE